MSIYNIHMLYIYIYNIEMMDKTLSLPHEAIEMIRSIDWREIEMHSMRAEDCRCKLVQVIEWRMHRKEEKEKERAKKDNQKAEAG